MGDLPGIAAFLSFVAGVSALLILWERGADRRRKAANPDLLFYESWVSGRSAWGSIGNLMVVSVTTEEVWVRGMGLGLMASMTGLNRRIPLHGGLTVQDYPRGNKVDVTFPYDGGAEHVQLHLRRPHDFMAAVQSRQKPPHLPVKRRRHNKQGR